MMAITESLDSWDWVNLVEKHVINTLAADSELGAGGSLEIKTWESEGREDASQYSPYELPAVIADAVLTGDGPGRALGADERSVRVMVSVITEAGGQFRRKKQAKQIVSRIDRIGRQQGRPGVELSGLPAALEGGVSGTLSMTVDSGVIETGKVDRDVRVVAAVACTVRVRAQLPEE